MSKAIDEAKEDMRQGRFYTSEEFMAEVEKRWPRKDTGASSALEHETTELNQALAKGMDDLQNGHVYAEEEFMAKVGALWRSPDAGSGCGPPNPDRHPAAAVLRSKDDSEATGSRAD
jgi:predicted transcriptional regulator